MTVKRHGKHLVCLKFPQSINELLSHWKNLKKTKTLRTCLFNGANGERWRWLEIVDDNFLTRDRGENCKCTRWRGAQNPGRFKSIGMSVQTVDGRSNDGKAKGPRLVDSRAHGSLWSSTVTEMENSLDCLKKLNVCFETSRRHVAPEAAQKEEDVYFCTASCLSTQSLPEHTFQLLFNNPQKIDWR